jgi:radical SAM superfamily enzyme YgiQ (UPF0313 family)
MSALLKADGFSVSLATLPGFRRDILEAAVQRRRPQCVLAELTPFSAAAAHRTIGDIAERRRLPVVAFGPLATARPEAAISIPGVQALLLAEYERTALEYFRALRGGRDAASVPGVWAHANGRLVRNAPAPLVQNLDWLPFPDRDLFDYRRVLNGNGEAAFRVSRGCPMWCASCLNDLYMDLYTNQGAYVRRRSVSNVIEEIAAVCSRYRTVRRLAFLDHGFTSDLEWLREFAAVCSRRGTLPYRCYVQPRSLNDEVLWLLTSSSCKAVRIRVGSGSQFIREEILTMNVSNAEFQNASQALRRAGIAVTAEVFVGSPYESEITVEETVELLRRAEVSHVRAEVFYPVPGTRAEELCVENGWISGRGEENYWLQQSVLDMPPIRARQIDATAPRLPSLVRRPRSLFARLLRRMGLRRRS